MDLLENKIIKEDILFDKQITTCFTGHRPQKLIWKFNENNLACLSVKTKLREKIISAIHRGYINFMCGMALGLDMIFAEIVLDLKKFYPQIKLIGALPCKNQELKWNLTQKKRYFNIISQLDYIRCKFDTYIGVECMYERNNFMLNNSSLLLAVFNGSNGGTKNTISRAKRMNIDIDIINIDDNYEYLLI